MKFDFPESEIPINKSGGKIWRERGEILVPESHPDTVRLKTFDCLNFDRATGMCHDYENRPEICRNTSCLKDDSTESVDEQHSKAINEKFVVIKKKAKNG